MCFTSDGKRGMVLSESDGWLYYGFNYDSNQRIELKDSFLPPQSNHSYSQPHACIFPNMDGIYAFVGTNHETKGAVVYQIKTQL